MNPGQRAIENRSILQYLVPVATPADLKLDFDSVASIHPVDETVSVEQQLPEEGSGSEECVLVTRGESVA